MPQVRRQLIAVIDDRTTLICLTAAGQIVPLEEPFDTVVGPQDMPPFHIHCRSIVQPWMPGFVNDVRADANSELMRRPLKQRDWRTVRHPPHSWEQKQALRLRAVSGGSGDLSGAVLKAKDSLENYPTVTHIMTNVDGPIRHDAIMASPKRFTVTINAADGKSYWVEDRVDGTRWLMRSSDPDEAMARLMNADLQQNLFDRSLRDNVIYAGRGADGQVWTLERHVGQGVLSTDSLRLSATVNTQTRKLLTVSDGLTDRQGWEVTFPGLTRKVNELPHGDTLPIDSDDVARQMIFDYVTDQTDRTQLSTTFVAEVRHDAGTARARLVGVGNSRTLQSDLRRASPPVSFDQYYLKRGQAGRWLPDLVRDAPPGVRGDLRQSVDDWIDRAGNIDLDSIGWRNTREMLDDADAAARSRFQRMRNVIQSRQERLLADRRNIIRSLDLGDAGPSLRRADLPHSAVEPLGSVDTVARRADDHVTALGQSGLQETNILADADVQRIQKQLKDLAYDGDTDGVSISQMMSARKAAKRHVSRQLREDLDATWGDEDWAAMARLWDDQRVVGHNRMRDIADIFDGKTDDTFVVYRNGHVYDIITDPDELRYYRKISGNRWDREFREAYDEGTDRVVRYGHTWGDLDPVNDVKDYVTSHFVKEWANSSGDDSPVALAVQRIAREAFDLPVPDAAFLQGAQAATRAAVHRITQRSGSQVADVLQAMYTRTQAELAAQGITRLPLVRGMGWSGAIGEQPVPRWVKDVIPSRDTTEVVVAGFPARTLPLSSWTTDLETAGQFSGHDAWGHLGAGVTSVTFYGWVPANRVIAFPQTGYGCLKEWEYVVLGGDADNVTAMFARRGLH